MATAFNQTNDMSQADVLITIGIKDMPGRIERRGRFEGVVGDYSLASVLAEAVSPNFLQALAEHKPDQYQEERELAEQIHAALSHNCFLIINNAPNSIPAARAEEIKMRDMVKRVPYPNESVKLFSLHARIEIPTDKEDAPAPDARQSDLVETALIESALIESAPEPGAAIEETAETTLAAALLEPSVADLLEEENIELATETEILQPDKALQKRRGGYKNKVETLKEEFREKVYSLDFRGLFVGNYGLDWEQLEFDNSRLEPLSQHTISEYLLNANSLRYRGEYERAVGYFIILIKNDPQNADYRFLLGRTYEEMGRIQSAINSYQQAQNLGHDRAGGEVSRLLKS
jgi:tetratricopeptide (TPR) repeat protein